MKIFKILLVITTLIFVGISSCKKKDGPDLIDDNNKWAYLPENSANVKVVQVFAGNTPQVPTAPNATTGPQVFIYANGGKLTGNSLGYGSVFPTSNVYATLPTGTTKFEIINGRLDLTVVPNLPKFAAGDTLNTFNTTLDKGKFYSLYITDTVPTMRVTLKEDVLTIPEVQTYKIRVANMVMNPLDTLVLFSRRQNAEVITDVTHKNVSEWVQLPLPIINDTFELRRKGTTTTYVTATLAGASGFLPVGQRLYTVVARGKTTGVTGKTPSAFIFINR